MSVHVIEITQCKQGFDAFLASLADANQDSSGERHGLFASKSNSLQTRWRQLIRRTMMRLSLPTKALGYTLEHNTLRDRYAAEGHNIGGGHPNVVEVGQQTGFAEGRFGCVRPIG